MLNDDNEQNVDVIEEVQDIDNMDGIGTVLINAATSNLHYLLEIFEGY